MTRNQILIGFGLVLAALIAIIVVADWGASDGPRETVEMSFGDHLISIKGHYKDLTQEMTADELLIGVDGHKIAVTNAQFALDGVVEALEPGQDLEIAVDEKGEISVTAAAPAADGGAPEEGDSPAGE